MSRTVRSFLPVGMLEVDPIATFTGDPAVWLPHARHVGPDRWTIDVGALGVERPVEVVVGDAWGIGATWWRSVRWTPLSEPSDPVAVERLLPSLDAELGLAYGQDTGYTLVLDGSYDPPGGKLGDALDAVALGRVARGTIATLLESIATTLRQRGEVLTSSR